MLSPGNMRGVLGAVVLGLALASDSDSGSSVGGDVTESWFGLPGAATMYELDAGRVLGVPSGGAEWARITAHFGRRPYPGLPAFLRELGENVNGILGGSACFSVHRATSAAQRMLQSQGSARDESEGAPSPLLEETAERQTASKANSFESDVDSGDSTPFPQLNAKAGAEESRANQLVQDVVRPFLVAFALIHSARQTNPQSGELKEVLAALNVPRGARVAMLRNLERLHRLDADVAIFLSAGIVVGAYRWLSDEPYDGRVSVLAVHADNVSFDTLLRMCAAEILIRASIGGQRREIVAAALASAEDTGALSANSYVWMHVENALAPDEPPITTGEWLLWEHMRRASSAGLHDVPGEILDANRDALAFVDVLRWLDRPVEDDPQRFVSYLRLHTQVADRVSVRSGSADAALVRLRALWRRAVALSARIGCSPHLAYISLWEMAELGLYQYELSRVNISPDALIAAILKSPGENDTRAMTLSLIVRLCTAETTLSLENALRIHMLDAVLPPRSCAGKTHMGTRMRLAGVALGADAASAYNDAVLELEIGAADRVAMLSIVLLLSLSPSSETGMLLPFGTPLSRTMANLSAAINAAATSRDEALFLAMTLGWHAPEAGGSYTLATLLRMLARGALLISARLQHMARSQRARSFGRVSGWTVSSSQIIGAATRADRETAGLSLLEANLFPPPTFGNSLRQPLSPRRAPGRSVSFSDASQRTVSHHFQACIDQLAHEALGFAQSSRPASVVARLKRMRMSLSVVDSVQRMFARRERIAFAELQSLLRSILMTTSL